MDLNYILSRHQLSLLAAEVAACPASRRSHLGLAIGYARRIRAYQDSVGAAAVLAAA